MKLCQEICDRENLRTKAHNRTNFTLIPLVSNQAIYPEQSEQVVQPDQIDKPDQIELDSYFTSFILIFDHGLTCFFMGPWDPKIMKFSKKCLCYQNVMPEPVFFISYLSRLSSYLHFGMLDRPSC